MSICEMGWPKPTYSPPSLGQTRELSTDGQGTKSFGLQCISMKVAELQLPLHKNFTYNFLNREDNNKDLLGKHWQDKIFPDRANRRLLQSIGHQFPCAKLLKL